MTTRSITSITDGQRKQYKRFVEDAADKALAEAGLDKDGIQKLIENGDKFQSRIMTGIRELSVLNQFADEEVQSSYAYPKGYKPNRDQPMDIIIADFEAQTKLLDKLFNCGTKFSPDWIVRTHVICPPWVEKFFAHFDWRKIASTYGEAVEKVLAMIASKRKFYNYREGELGEEYLRQHAKTVKMFQKLGDEQKDHDILVVPAQFGLRHRGRSGRRAREVFAGSEFGLGAFAISIMFLTHPEREVQRKQLHVDCAGDEFSPGANGDFSSAPVFDFDDGRVWFSTRLCNIANWYYGSASGFVSQ